METTSDSTKSSKESLPKSLSMPKELLAKLLASNEKLTQGFMGAALMSTTRAMEQEHQWLDDEHQLYQREMGVDSQKSSDNMGTLVLGDITVDQSQGADSPKKESIAAKAIGPAILAAGLATGIGGAGYLMSQPEEVVEIEDTDNVVQLELEHLP